MKSAMSYGLPNLTSQTKKVELHLLPIFRFLAATLFLMTISGHCLLEDEAPAYIEQGEKFMLLNVIYTFYGNKCFESPDTIEATQGASYGPYSETRMCFHISSSNDLTISADALDPDEYYIEIEAWEPYIRKSTKGAVQLTLPGSRSDTWIQIECPGCDSWNVQF